MASGSIDELVSLFVFEKEGPFQKIAHALKYSGAQQLGVELGRRLGTVLQRDGIEADMIVPVPLHKRKLRERGYNQSELLTRCVARQLTLPCCEGLARVRPTAPQVGLTDSQRQENVRNAFRCRNAGQISGRRILLVDDVMTTGATVASAAQALLDGGALRVSVLTVARAGKW